MPSVTASGSALSRRVSEVVGVGLFAAALIWLVALASYDTNDPAWFFSTGDNVAPVNFAGRVGAFLAELSFQLLGYASFLIPAVTAVVGWRYFWCRPVNAAYTKLTGALLLLACSSAFMAITLGRVDLGPRDFRAGGYIGEWIGGWMADFLSRTGSVIVLMAVMAGAVILATQFSFGHLFAVLFSLAGARLRQLGGDIREWRAERERARQRREVLAKHGKKEEPELAKPKVARVAERPAPPPPARPAAREEDEDEDERPRAGGTPPVVQKKAPARLPATQPLPLPEPERTPAERRMGGFTLPPLTLLDPPKASRRSTSAS